MITGYWSSIYIHKDWAGRTSMPGDIGKYRRMRVGVELLVVVTSETPEKFLGMVGRMQHDRPISKKVGSSATSGGHDLDVDLLGPQFGVNITVTKNGIDEIDGLIMEYDLPDITEPTGPGGTQVPTVNRKVIAIARLTDVDSARQGLYKYFEWLVSVVHHNLLTDNKFVEERGVIVFAPRRMLREIRARIGSGAQATMSDGLPQPH